jgi:carboxypeptidase C (cathepsin A)
MSTENTAVATDIDNAKRQRESVEKLLALPPFKAEGKIQLGRASVEYDVVSSFIPVVDRQLSSAGSEPQAAIFTTAYLKKGTKASSGKNNSGNSKPNSRPICFAFNGGPGSASIWLHLGALGPKRVPINDDGSAPAAPFFTVDNPDSWLEFFDLVFIDPAHTGWSIGASTKDREHLLSVDGDVKSLVEVIRVWLTRHQRWGSPIYLAGESYGTTRGAALADSLQEASIPLTGLILVSCAMDLQTLVFEPANDLPYPLFLPAIANTAQYHGLLKGPLAKSSAAARAAAQDYAEGDYLKALHAGARLSQKEFSQTAARLSELTGLPSILIEQHNLRISDQLYFFEAMRSQGNIVGRLDSRVIGPMGLNRTRTWEFDPGIDAIAGPYRMAAAQYFAGELGIHLEQPYETLNPDVYKQWRWNRGESKGNQYTSTTPDLARAMRRNSHLKVFVASGRYDLGTPYSATDWSLAQLDINGSTRKRLTHHYYDAGHMMYTRSVDLTKLKVDLAHWLKVD